VSKEMYSTLSAAAGWRGKGLLHMAGRKH